MAKSKKRKSLPPRVKRMKLPARLDSAKKRILTYTGKHLLHDYCNHYAVDWRCAVIELKLLGITIDPAYISQRERTEAEMQRQRQAKKKNVSLCKTNTGIRSPTPIPHTWLAILPHYTTCKCEKSMEKNGSSTQSMSKPLAAIVPLTMNFSKTYGRFNPLKNQPFSPQIKAMIGFPSDPTSRFCKIHPWQLLRMYSAPRSSASS